MNDITRRPENEEQKSASNLAQISEPSRAPQWHEIAARKASEAGVNISPSAIKQITEVKIIALDHKRAPHPQREERLKNRRTAAPGAEEMQRMMRQVHQDRELRAEVVKRARKCVSQRRTSRRRVKHHVD
jgi:hypothetical protein